MLQSIRDYTQGWIAGIIISLVILSFALFGIHSYLTGGGANNDAAKVNGVEITKSELANAYERLRRQLQTQFAGGNIPTHIESTMKQQALQTLIEFQVLKQASYKEGFRISPWQVDGYVQSMPEFQVNGTFSIDRFQQVMMSAMFSPNEFHNLIQTSLLIDQPRLGIILSAFALPEEVNRTIALVNEQRDISYLLIPESYLANKPLTISDNEIQTYYQQHQQDFQTKEQVTVEYLLLNAKNLSTKIQPSDQVLQNYYNENASSFMQPAEWQLESITIPSANTSLANEIANKAKATNQSLGNLSKQYPNVTVTKPGTWLTLDKVPTELQSTVSQLTKLSAVSTPHQTKEGFVIIKVVGFKEPKTLSFAAVKTKVREAFVNQQAEESFASAREKLANLTYEHPDSLDFAAKELNLPVQTTEPFAKDKSNTGIGVYDKVREAAFSGDVLNLKNNSEVIQIAPDTVVVVRVKDHIPANLLSLDQVKGTITQQVKSNKLNEQTLQLANEIKTKLQKGKSKEQIASEYHLNWTNAGFVGRNSSQLNDAILNVAFQLPKTSSPAKSSYGVAKVPAGLQIVAVNNVKQGTPDNTSNQQNVFAEQVQNSIGLLEYELYKNSLMSKAKIVVE